METIHSVSIMVRREIISKKILGVKCVVFFIAFGKKMILLIVIHTRINDCNRSLAYIQCSCMCELVRFYFITQMTVNGVI